MSAEQTASLQTPAAASSVPDMAEPKGLVKIGAAAKMLGITTKQLLYRETTGALLPACRAKGGTRYYDPATLSAALASGPRLVKIGQAAAMLGINTKQLIYRETIGTLLPDFKTETGHRYYDTAKLPGGPAASVPPIGFNEAAAILGITTGELLHREAIGDLMPVGKAEDGARCYDRTEVESRTGLVKIGDAAKIIGASHNQMRYWEKRGQLLPAARTTGGTRYYRKDEVLKFRRIYELTVGRRKPRPPKA